MSEQNIYCGNGRKIETKFGEMMKLSFSADDLKKLNDNLDRGWVNAVVKERREPSETGVTHYLQIDTWKPEETQKNVPSSSESKKEDEKVIEFDDNGEDLPF